MLNGRDFHYEQWRFSCWTVKIFMLNTQDFHNERSRFSWWNSRDFHVERSRFSWWTVEIFTMTHNDAIMARPDLLYCFGLNPGARGEHLAIQLLAFIHVKEANLYLPSRWVLLFLLNKLNEMRTLDESKAVSFCFWCYSKERGRKMSAWFPCITSGNW